MRRGGSETRPYDGYKTLCIVLQRQAVQSTAVCIAVQHATLFVPVAQHDAARGFAVEIVIVNRGPVGVAVDELRHVMAA